MKKLITAIAACAALAPAVAFASPEAIAAAQKADICSVLDADFNTAGQLQVKCKAGTVSPEYQALVQTPGAGAGLGAGLTTSAGLAIGAGVILAAILIGDDSTPTTTTTGGS